VAGHGPSGRQGRPLVRHARPVRRRLSAEEAAERAKAGQRPAYDADGRPALVVRGFKLERVFRYEDTEGEPLREASTPGYLTGDSPDGAWAALTALVKQHGYRLTTTAEPGDTRGHTDYTAKNVNVDPGYPPAEQLHILVHELAHP
jgi:hypothetical protein